MNSRLVATSLAMLVATVFVTSAQAQGHGAFRSAPVGRNGMVVGRGRGVRIGTAHFQRARRFYPDWGFWPYYYSDYESEPETNEAPPPNPIGTETAQAISPAVVPRPSESLMLELRGDHWVRITNYGQSEIGDAASPTESSSTSQLFPHRTQPAEPPSSLPPAVLVFRDGHQEELRRYTIVGSAIYTREDYWSEDSWTRAVRISELDLPATLKLNHERNTKFALPSGPNEVMSRP